MNEEVLLALLKECKSDKLASMPPSTRKALGEYLRLSVAELTSRACEEAYSEWDSSKGGAIVVTKKHYMRVLTDVLLDLC